MNELSSIKGIGPSTINKLTKLDITTIDDLVSYYPYRYEEDKGPGTGGMGCLSFENGLLPFLEKEELQFNGYFLKSNNFMYCILLQNKKFISSRLNFCLLLFVAYLNIINIILCKPFKT